MARFGQITKIRKNMKKLLLLFLGFGLFSTDAYSITVLEFCKSNPNHKSVKIISLVYKQAAPHWAVVYLWRQLVTGEYKFMPNDFKRHYLMSAAKDIGAELGWDKEKIDAEVDALFAELKRIQNQ